MAYVITSPCIDVKDGACVDVCPVDCIYEGGRMFYIQPDECIDCGICESICPVAAIYPDDDLPAEEAPFLAANRAYFGAEVTGLGRPGGASGEKHRRDADHPLIAAAPANPDTKAS
ncbi:ferredoxin [Oceanibacterium hippocampi]|uniref:Ferredoxin n=1 Tax=Oceanibacterium hippocampi TaxID=745714 RepID=A0A1Y5SQX9_9PROT|nr:ferredoxin [Oceanibacterium hippocampi]SLN43285.1 Ferredoxin [Oceanibacterium hippocampi]